jgi:hypothetical protein
VQTSIQKGYEGGISIGQKQLWVFSGAGPNPASNAGDTLLFPAGIYIDWVAPAIDNTGTYLAIPYPSTGGPRPTWKFLYFNLTSWAVLNSGNLSASTFVFEALGGEF